MSDNINLNKLKDEIKRRKETKSNIGIDANNTNLQPKDQFLNGLLESLNSGRETHASKLVKMVDNKVAEKKGENIRHTINNTEIPQNTKTQNSVDRDGLLYEEIEKRSNNLLNKKRYGSVNENELLTSLPQQSGMINEEIIKKIITDNFEHLIENALKNSIVNIFMSERIKEVINENEDIVKNVVLKTLKELYKKKKT